MIVVLPTAEMRMSLFELCCLAGAAGMVLSNRRMRNGRSLLVFTRVNA